MKEYVQMFLDSSILQAFLAIMIWGVICYMYATGANVPDALLAAGSVILGFYFQSASIQTFTKMRG